MRSLYLLITMLYLVSGFNAYAQYDDLMERGNNFYKNEQYDEAISLYNRILENGFESGPLYYNIGNSYFRLGKLGNAILFFEKALKVDPGNDDARYNLLLANARIVDKIKELPEVPILEYWNIIVATLSLSGWLTLFIVFWILFLAGVAVYFIIGRVRIQRMALMVSLFNLTMLLIIGIFMFSSYHRESTTDYGVLLRSTVTAKTSPDASQNDAFVIHEGIKFQIEEKLSDWSKIKLADGKIGWLPNETFEAI